MNLHDLGGADGDAAGGRAVEPGSGSVSVARTAVELAGVAKTYRRRGVETHALASVDLAIREGEFLAIVGPSGCGKSTLLRLVAGLHLASAGEVRIGGRVVDRPQTALGIVFQSPVLLDVAKQVQRNREAFKQPPEAMPVFGTMASRFADDGVTALYQAVAPVLVRSHGC